MATTARRDSRERARLRGFVRSLMKAATRWRSLDAAYMADLEREARIYLVRLAQCGRPASAAPMPITVTFYPKRSKKKGTK